MAPGGGGVEGGEVEFVRGAGVKVELDGYADLAEAQGVGEVFVAELRAGRPRCRRAAATRAAAA
jgi:hypothetical protein